MCARATMTALIPEWYSGMSQPHSHFGSGDSAIAAPHKDILELSWAATQNKCPAGPPSLYSDISKDVALGPLGSREEFVNSQDTRLASYFFPAEGKAKAVIVLVHGHGCR